VGRDRFGSGGGRALCDAPASEPSAGDAADSRLLAKVKSTPELLALCNKPSSERRISPKEPSPGGEQPPAISSSSTEEAKTIEEVAYDLLTGRSAVRESTKASKHKNPTPSLKRRPAAAESAPRPAKCLRRPAAAGHAAAVPKRGYKDPAFPGVPRARRDSEVIEGAKHTFTLYTDMGKGAWRLLKHGQVNDRGASFTKAKLRES
jgi:hypothetical protein